ncbi:MAG: FkbM family methyltransferase [Candidatus Saccharibacteria bacterium]|nr:FkbM family methyltransferase [Candidatus Saccharibacteria bacterium]
MKPIIYYGQNREDLILSAFFPDEKDGFYVDVGAHHPVKDSVTKLFYDKGWTGINIEPQPKQHKLLKQKRPRDINLQIGISDKPGKLQLRSYAMDGFSTFSDSIKKEHKQGKIEGTKKYRDYEVEVDTLGNVFKKHGVKKISFLKVDVEGLEYEVLAGNNWNKFRPEVLCIEANHIVKDWRSLLKQNRYSYVLFDGLNEYFVSHEAEFRIELFRKTYPDILVSSSVLSYGWSQQIDKLSAQLQKVQATLDNQMHANKQLQETINQQEKELRSVIALSKRLAKRTVKKLLPIKNNFNKD